MKHSLFAGLGIASVVALFVGMLLALSSAPAHTDGGGCINKWPWQQSTAALRTQQYEHKAIHALGLGAVTWAGASLTGDIWAGVIPALFLGAWREADKVSTAGQRCEYPSIALDLTGIGVAAYGKTHWFVAPTAHGVALNYVARF